VENPHTSSDLPLHPGIASFLTGSATAAEKIRMVQVALENGDRDAWRKELGEWAAGMVPVELLVPEVHQEWRPLVRDGIGFVVSRLSAPRLAPKIVEQMALGMDVPAEERLLRFIAKVPGLQKIGQVLARNRQQHPRLRRALIKLENGISDVSIEEICSIIRNDLRAEMDGYEIRLAPRILSEASVSAVVRFSWRNPATRRRERGVFKVLKPHIKSCYAEDMKILGELGRHLARRRHVTGGRLGRLVETLTEIRLLLEREVDFPREQATLADALNEYRCLQGVRIPRLIPSLSTATITALTFEEGRKVTEARTLPGSVRVEVAERLVQALLSVPAFSRERDAIFHADPHAGNLLYDKRHDQLVILDWALTERLSRRQRKNIVLLVLMTMLRDADGMTEAIEELCQGKIAGDRAQMQNIRTHVDRLLDRLPLGKLPGPMEALRLLERIALDGMPFLPSLLMFRKAAFTLEGVVEDTARSRVPLDTLFADYAMENWKATIVSLFRLLSAQDWLALDWSALTFTSRVCARALSHPWNWLLGFSTSVDAA
jgi:ubiquinone biosynthesis protein